MSYCPDDSPPSVRVWRTGAVGFFSGLLGMSQAATATFPLPACAATRTDLLLQNTRLRWLSPTQVALTREDRSEARFTLD